MPFPKNGDIVYVARQNCCGEVTNIDLNGDNTASLDLRVRHVSKGKESWQDTWRVLSVEPSDIKILNTPKKVFDEVKRLERRSDIVVGKKLVNEIGNLFFD